MTYQRVRLDNRYLAGLTLLGPWEETVASGFEKLELWVAEQSLSGERIAVYFDDPDVTPSQELRCYIGITVGQDYCLPAINHDLSLMTLNSGDYGASRATIKNDAFHEAWEQLFDELDADTEIKTLPKPCFERYLSGPSAQGDWDIEMYVPIIYSIQD